MNRESSQRAKTRQNQKTARAPLFDLPLDEEPRDWRKSRLFRRDEDDDNEARRPAGRARQTPPAGRTQRSTQTSSSSSSNRASGQTPARPAQARARPAQSSRPRQRKGLFGGPLDTELDRFEAEMHAQRSGSSHPFLFASQGGYLPLPSPPQVSNFLRHPLHLMIIAIISLIIIAWLGPQNKQTFLSGFSGLVDPAQVANTLGIPNPFAQATPNPPGDYRLRAPPSVSAQQIDSILASYHSPAAGTGQAWIDLGKKYDIDPAFAVAFFIHESTAGTHPGWAGLKPDGSSTHNVGNIICAGYATCYGRFRDYGSWEEGIEDWYRLIAVEYIEGRGTETVADIIPIYAPAFENDVNAYVRTVERLVDGWRSEHILGSLGDETPSGNPLNVPNAVMTQGYGVGSHAPADVWGAIDLAIDSNGDGSADPQGTWDQPIYATHSGMVEVTENSFPAGNHVWVINQHFKTSYAHLNGFAVGDGQIVRRGDVIGYIGSTGQSSGPHLDYQVWQNTNGTWLNKNPLEYGVQNLIR